jgi:large repetitive protein
MGYDGPEVPATEERFPGTPPRRVLDAVLLLFAVLSLTGCWDLLVDTPSASSAALTVLVAPVQPEGPVGFTAAFNAADRMRIRLIQGGRTLADLDQEFTPKWPRAQIGVEVDGEEESLQLEVTLFFRGQALFEAEQSITVGKGGTTSVRIPLRPVPNGVRVEGGPVVLEAIGAEARLSGAVLFATGDPIPGLGLTWTSSTPSVVEVSPEGVVRAIAPGETEIIASHEGFSQSLTVKLEQAAASVTVKPVEVELISIGQRVPFEAEAVDANGHPVPLIPEDFMWSSSDASVATVSAQGMATAHGSGTATVTATRDGAQGSAALLVHAGVASVEAEPNQAELTAVGGTLTFTATARDADRNRIPLGPEDFEWSSSDVRVATISEDGVATATGNGTATIMAVRDGVAGVSPLTVRQVVISVTVEAGTAEQVAALGETRTFTATARDANGNLIPLGASDFIWSSSNVNVATISDEGVATATGNGITTVLATREAVGARRPLVVRQEAVSVRVEPMEAAMTIALGEKVIFTATATDGNGGPLPLNPGDLTWSSSDGAVATVSEEGVATAIGNGTSTITATLEGVAGSAVVHVAVPLVVHFPDPNLEAAVRNAIGKPTGEILTTDLVGLTHLSASSSGIFDLTGLEFAHSLEALTLNVNSISDLTPLQGLTGLTSLALGDNAISDLMPIQGLTGLTSLHLFGNSITDLTPLQGLSGLTGHLSLSRNSISDLAPLQGLTELSSMSLGDNAISDLTPLRGITALTWLSLDNNPISDLDPLRWLTGLTFLGLRNGSISDVGALVDNDGLAAGDEVRLSGNPLSQEALCDQVPALQIRGVSVSFGGTCES